MGLLRTLLAITVVCAHSPLKCEDFLVGGRNAVQLFYVISGFLIAHVLQTNPAYANPYAFYANRILRLYPIYLVVAILSLLIYRGGNHPFFDIYEDIPFSAAVFLAVSNVLLIGQDMVMFCDIRSGHLAYTFGLPPTQTQLFVGLIVPQAWTLGVELSFYALAPFILRSNALLITLLMVSLMIRGYLLAIGLGTTDPWSYRFFPAELSLFLLGALSQRYVLPAWVRVIASCTPNPARGRWIAAAGTSALVAMCLVYGLVPLAGIIKVPLLFLLALLLMPLAFLWQGGSRLDRAIGDLSYPVYICHIMVALSLAALPEALLLEGSVARTLGNIVAALLVAWLLNRYVGKPVEALRARIRSTPTSLRAAS